MTLFSKMKTTGLEASTDTLGGGFQPLETDVYTGPIKMAYAGKSSGGADFLYVSVDINGREYRETFYLTNKAGENSWVMKDRDGNPIKNADGTVKRKAMKGFEIVNDICLAATGADLSEQPFEDKVVKIYDNDAKKELPKSVPVAVDLLGQSVSLAIFNVLENKSRKEGNDYVPTEETRNVNAVEKVFNTETRMTVNEASHGATEAKFWDAWVAKNKGQVQDKRTLKDGAGAGQSGRPTPGRAPSGPPMAGVNSNAGAPKKSLFAKSA